MQADAVAKGKLIAGRLDRMGLMLLPRMDEQEKLSDEQLAADAVFMKEYSRYKMKKNNERIKSLKEFIHCRKMAFEALPEQFVAMATPESPVPIPSSLRVYTMTPPPAYLQDGEGPEGLAAPQFDIEEEKEQEAPRAAAVRASSVEVNPRRKLMIDGVVTEEEVSEPEFIDPATLVKAEPAKATHGHGKRRKKK